MKGKSKLLQRKRGRVTGVLTEGSKKKYRIEWTDSSVGDIFGRSLEKNPAGDAPGVASPLFFLSRSPESLRITQKKTRNLMVTLILMNKKTSMSIMSSNHRTGW